MHMYVYMENVLHNVIEAYNVNFHRMIFKVILKHYLRFTKNHLFFSISKR